MQSMMQNTKTSFRLALACAGVLASSLLSACGSQSLKVTAAYKDVTYTTTAGKQKLDLYLPSGNGPFPLIINIHGGGFKFGDKSMMPTTLFDALLNDGYAIASIDYRLSGDAIFPAAVLDAKAAVRYLRANAAKYKINPNKIVAYGESAGGHIASMLGTTGDVAEFDDASLGNTGVSSRVQAVINHYGPTDFAKMDEQAKAQGCGSSDQTHNAANSFESAFLGAAVQTVPELVKKANPITYISKDDPPFLVQKGDKDCTVPIESTKMLSDALKAANQDVRFDLLAGAGHGDGSGSPIFQSAANIQVVQTFLKEKLK